MPTSPIARVVAVISLLSIAALGALLILRGPSGPSGSDTATIGGDFTLTDQFGKTRSDTEFRGKLMLIYFGFTHCPDLCPLDLQKMSQAMNKLGPEADRVVPIFITVDPARDDVAAMHDYVASFDPRFVALTGDKAAIDRVAASYHVYYKADEGAAGQGDGANYGVTHSSIIYLMGRDGRYLTHFGQEASADQIAAGIAKQL